LSSTFENDPTWTLSLLATPKPTGSSEALLTRKPVLIRSEALAAAALAVLMALTAVRALGFVLICMG
jgi:hypothetical protein